VRWTKRLKWIRLSKIIIPIALAISLIFAGFTVYSHKAQNFVIRVNGGGGEGLALTLNADPLVGQTTYLQVPVDGAYTNVTWDGKVNRALAYNTDSSWGISSGIPNDIATHSGVHSLYTSEGDIAFYSFSFWLVNNNDRAVDISYSLNIDSIVKATNTDDIHIDDAVRIMLIPGVDTLLSDETYTVYKKAEPDDAEEEELLTHVDYGEDYLEYFKDDKTIFSYADDLGYRSVASGEALRFTLVIWLEGWDDQCVNEIIPEILKMSMTFTAE